MGTPSSRQAGWFFAWFLPRQTKPPKLFNLNETISVDLPFDWLIFKNLTDSHTWRGLWTVRGESDIMQGAEPVMSHQSGNSFLSLTTCRSRWDFYLKATALRYHEQRWRHSMYHVHFLIMSSKMSIPVSLFLPPPPRLCLTHKHMSSSVSTSSSTCNRVLCFAALLADMNKDNAGL